MGASILDWIKNNKVAVVSFVLGLIAGGVLWGLGR